MARPRARGRRRGGHAAGHEDNERWLLTYADMITLLMALFMVLFSISSVNISKFRVVQQALHAAFSGDILPGGKAIAQPGATANSSHAPSSADVQAIVPLTAQSANLSRSPTSSPSQAQQEQNEFIELKHQLDAYAASHGFANQVSTTIERRGLVIRVLTDRLLFASGSATLYQQGYGLLDEIAALVNLDSKHPIAVEGHTDNVPISGGAFPSNWELSTARASTVVRYLISRGVYAPRLSASGYADLRPIANNATAAGRARNRRVEIVLQRLYGTTGTTTLEESDGSQDSASQEGTEP